MDVLNERPDITKFVKSVTNGLKINNYKITDVKTNRKGEGFLSEIFMITLIDESTQKSHDFIVKAAFQDEKIRELTPIRLSFENEIYFYSTVYPQFKRLEMDHLTESVNLTAECYFVTLTEQCEMLALENLKVLGFETFNKKLILDDAHLRLIFKNYGQLHAYSFALRDQHPEKYEEIVGKFHDLYTEFFKVPFFKQHMEGLMDSALSNLTPGKDDKVIEKFQKYLNGQVIDRFQESISQDCDYPAILHGDCWSNNMLFKYKNNGEEKSLIDMRLIDFQIIKVGSPVCDLSYCLYSGASKNQFDNLDEYLKIYHKTFSTFLRQLGSDPEKLFPFKALKEEWKQYCKFGLLMGINIVKMKLTEQEDIMDLTDFDGTEENMEKYNKIKFNEEEFGQRCGDLLRHLAEIEAL